MGRRGAFRRGAPAGDRCVGCMRRQCTLAEWGQPGISASPVVDLHRPHQDLVSPRSWLRPLRHDPSNRAPDFSGCWTAQRRADRCARVPPRTRGFAAQTQGPLPRAPIGSALRLLLGRWGRFRERRRAGLQVFSCGFGFVRWAAVGLRCSTWMGHGSGPDPRRRVGSSAGARGGGERRACVCGGAHRGCASRWSGTITKRGAARARRLALGGEENSLPSR